METDTTTDDELVEVVDEILARDPGACLYSVNEVRTEEIDLYEMPDCRHNTHVLLVGQRDHGQNGVMIAKITSPGVGHWERDPSFKRAVGSVILVDDEDPVFGGSIWTCTSVSSDRGNTFWTYAMSGHDGQVVPMASVVLDASQEKK